MEITLYRRSYPAKDAPVALSLVPYSDHQKHTFTAGGKVYDAERSELRVHVPDGATIDSVRNLLAWAGDKGQVKSTAAEVFELARSRAPGFRMAK